MKVLSITQRLMLIAALLVMTIIGLVSLETIVQYHSMVNERKDKIHDMTESIVASIKSYDEQVTAGRISLEDAQKEIQRVVRGMRWDEGDYFVIFNEDGLFLVHPNPKYVNVNRIDWTDANGFRVIEAEIKVARAGGGFVDTVVPRANQSVAKPKVLYAAAYPPWHWIISTGAYIDDIDETIRGQVIWMIGLGALCMLITAVMVVMIARSISQPVNRLRESMQVLAQGNTDIIVPYTDWPHETGAMAKAVDVFRQNMRRADELAAAQRAEQDAKIRRQNAIEGFVVDFEQRVGQSLERLSFASSDMRSTSESMSGIARKTSEQAKVGAVAAEAASANVQTVASATEELSSSVSEIGRQVSSSTQIAGEAVAAANRTNRTVQGLSSAAQKIGDVVQLISAIASQTNLLALNATIEAARAGEAGKGFAVVASEVKNLANQTARATEEISEQVKAMQDATNDAVQAIQGIGGTIASINEITTAIASAVEEQGAATQEIARNIQEAAQRTGQVSQTIVNVNQAAVQTGETSNKVLTSAETVSRHADDLRGDIHAFLTNIREA